jgi:hypothetical protein
MAHTFELGPVEFEEDETKQTLGGIATRLVQITPPTGFDPEYLTSILKDPNEKKNFRNMVPYFTRQTMIRRVVQNEVMTVFEISSTEENVGSEQLDQAVGAIKLIVDAEDSSVQDLRQTIDEARSTLFK